MHKVVPIFVLKPLNFTTYKIQNVYEYHVLQIQIGISDTSHDEDDGQYRIYTSQFSFFKNWVFFTRLNLFVFIEKSLFITYPN